MSLVQLLQNLQHLEDYMSLLQDKGIDTTDIEDFCCEVSLDIDHEMTVIRESTSYKKQLEVSS